jgi:uncharacterized small protein (DUF1192 family)
VTKAATVEKVNENESNPTGVEQARAKVEGLARAEVDRYRQLAPKKRELFEAQQARDFKKAALLREEVEYLEDTESGRRERREAIGSLHLLQAQELEEKVAALTAEIGVRQARAKVLFAKLEEQEHVDFEREMGTRYLDDRTITQQLQNDASAKTVRATFLRNTDVVDYGTATGHTADELIEDLMRIPEVLGPSIASIYERVKRAGRGSGKGDYMRMQWLKSRIDELGWIGIFIPDDQPRRTSQGASGIAKVNDAGMVNGRK